MEKCTEVIRAKCDSALKNRVNRYVKSKRKLGLHVHESDLVREAMVLFLDKQDAESKAAK